MYSQKNKYLLFISPAALIFLGFVIFTSSVSNAFSTNETKLNQAQQLFEKGEIGGSISRYLKLLKKNPDDFDAMTDLGLIYLATQNMDSAQIYLNRANQQRPSSAQAASNLAFLFMQKNDFKKAEKLLEKALEEKPYDEQSMLYKGFLFLKQKRVIEAQKQIQRVIRKHPASAKGYVNLARLQMIQRQNFNKAKKNLQKAIEIQPETVKNYFYLSRIYELEGNLKNARGILIEAQKYAPKSIPLSLAIGNFYYIEGNQKKADEFFSKAKEIAGDNTALQIQLARYHFSIGNRAAALQLLDDALKASPKDPKLQNESGKVLFDIGLFGNAIQRFENAVAIQADFWEAHNNLAKTYMTIGRYKKAKKEYSKLLHQFPHNPEFIYRQGLAYQSLGDTVHAIHSYQKALKEDPNHIPSLNALGLTLFNSGQQKEGEKAIRKALNIDSNYAAARNNLGYIFFSKADYQGAARQFEAVLEKDPKNDNAISNLARVRLAQGDMDAAETLLMKSVALTGGDASTFNRLALFNLKKGRISRAGLFLKAALKRDPKNPIYYNNLGSLFLDIGYTAAAKESFKKATELNPKNIRYRLNMAQALVQNGEYIPAEKMLSKMKEDSPIKLLRGYLKLLLGDWDSARNTFAELIHKDKVEPLARQELARLNYSQGLYRDALEILRPLLDTKKEKASLMMKKIFSASLLKMGKISEAKKILRSIHHKDSEIDFFKKIISSKSFQKKKAVKTNFSNLFSGFGSKSNKSSFLFGTSFSRKQSLLLQKQIKDLQNANIFQQINRDTLPQIVFLRIEETRSFPFPVTLKNKIFIPILKGQNKLLRKQLIDLATLLLDSKIKNFPAVWKRGLAEMAVEHVDSIWDSHRILSKNFLPIQSLNKRLKPLAFFFPKRNEEPFLAWALTRGLSEQLGIKGFYQVNWKTGRLPDGSSLIEWLQTWRESFYKKNVITLNQLTPQNNLRSFLFKVESDLFSHLKHKNFEEMIGYLKTKGLSENGNNPAFANVYFYVALAYSRMRQYEKGIKLLQKSAKLGSSKATLLDESGWALAQQDYTQAAILYGLKVARKMDISGSAFKTAFSLEKLGRLRKAKKYYEVVLKVDPENKDARRRLKKLNRR